MFVQENPRYETVQCVYMHHRIIGSMNLVAVRKAMFKTDNLNESATMFLRTGAITHSFTKKAVPYNPDEGVRLLKSIDIDLSKAKEVKNKNI